VFYGRVMGPLASPAGRLHAEIQVELPIFSLGRRFLSRYIRAAHFHVRESRKAAELARSLLNLSYFSGAGAPDLLKSYRRSNHVEAR
jgi:hypothetical protein